MFGSILTKLRPDFDPRNFGHKKQSHLVRDRADHFRIEERTVVGTESKDIYVRERYCSTWFLAPRWAQ